MVKRYCAWCNIEVDVSGRPNNNPSSNVYCKKEHRIRFWIRSRAEADKIRRRVERERGKTWGSEYSAEVPERCDLYGKIRTCLECTKPPEECKI